jgi:hypothetical protein
MKQNQSLVDRSNAALKLGIKEQTLAAWACNKRYDLPYIKIGRRAMYSPDDLDAFINCNRIGSTND